MKAISLKPKNHGEVVFINGEEARDMEFRRRTINFAPLEGSGPRSQSFTEVFTRSVTTAVAGIAGFSTGFSEPSDRPLGELDIGAVASIDANTVTVDVTFGLRDWSEEWDDAYSGVVDVV